MIGWTKDKISVFEQLTFDSEGKEMIRKVFARACNSWPDAPAEIMEIHDILVHGKILQNYRAMPVYVGRENLPPEENQKLDQRLKSAAEKSGSIAQPGSKQQSD